ncbi:hypothetical protein ACTJK6_20545 [Ralstonia sp. 22086]
MARNGKSGAFWGCSNYRVGCRYTLQMGRAVSVGATFNDGIADRIY